MDADTPMITGSPDLCWLAVGCGSPKLAVIKNVAKTRNGCASGEQCYPQQCTHEIAHAYR